MHVMIIYIFKWDYNDELLLDEFQYSISHNLKINVNAAVHIVLFKLWGANLYCNYSEVRSILTFKNRSIKKVKIQFRNYNLSLIVFINVWSIYKLYSKRCKYVAIEDHIMLI